MGFSACLVSFICVCTALFLCRQLLFFFFFFFFIISLFTVGLVFVVPVCVFVGDFCIALQSCSQTLLQWFVLKRNLRETKNRLFCVQQKTQQNFWTFVHSCNWGSSEEKRSEEVFVCDEHVQNGCAVKYIILSFTLVNFCLIPVENKLCSVTLKKKNFFKCLANLVNFCWKHL